LANNYRMTELQGAVALAQLRKLDSIISRRQSWCSRLTARISNLAGLQVPVTQERGTHSYWFYPMRVDKQTLGADADQFAEAMKKEGVPVAAHYIGKPIYKYPLFQNHTAFERGEHPYQRIDYTKVTCTNTEAILDSFAILSVNEAYSDADLDETVKA